MSLPLDIEAKLAQDMVSRLTIEGMPRNLGNDYERHLFARRLALMGKGREEVANALWALGLADVPINRRANYVEDVLSSVLVGLPSEGKPMLPVYQEFSESSSAYKEVGGN